MKKPEPTTELFGIFRLGPPKIFKSNPFPVSSIYNFNFGQQGSCFAPSLRGIKYNTIILRVGTGDRDLSVRAGVLMIVGMILLDIVPAIYLCGWTVDCVGD